MRILDDAAYDELGQMPLSAKKPEYSILSFFQRAAKAAGEKINVLLFLLLLALALVIPLALALVIHLELKASPLPMTSSSSSSSSSPSPSPSSSPSGDKSSKCWAARSIAEPPHGS